MKLKAVSGIMLTLLLMGMLTLAFNIQLVEAGGTIYIRADGSVEGTTDISTVDNITYTFIANNYDSIVVERDNIVVDGAGYTLQGTVGRVNGIALSGRSNVTIKNIEIGAFQNGIYLYDSTNNNVCGNTITENDWYGIRLEGSSNNIISGNNIIDNHLGIGLDSSSNNVISGNKITNNREGIGLSDSSNNTFTGNNITNNEFSISFIYSSNNTISGNNITNNGSGIFLGGCSNTVISGNNITNNWRGIRLWESSNNTIYHNSFINNTQQVYDHSWGDWPYLPSINTWDDGYPSGGNYWSDHVTVDDYSGINQDELGSDGTVDEPYIIDVSNRDNYPLMNPWGPPPPVDWWSMFRHDLSHTGYSTSTAPNTNNTIWSYPTGDWVKSSPAVADGKVYVGSCDDKVYCLDASTGDFIWSYTTGDWVFSSPAVADGKVYVGSEDGKVYAFGTLPFYTLTIYGSPIAVTFTVDGVSRTTPWSETYSEGASVSLVMPEIHSVGDARYYWDQWSDGNTSQTRTVTMTENITLTAYYTGPYYELTTTSSPITGITFTVNGTQQTTPYTEWLPEGYYTLEMPQTHNGYVWSHWLEDGDPNRIKTILLQGTTWTAVYEPAPKPVGGKATPIDKVAVKTELHNPLIWLSIIILPLVATVIFIRHKKKKQ